MEKKEKKVKENVVTGMSSTVGAAVGVVAGSAVAQPVSAAETEEEAVVTEVVTPSRPETEPERPVEPIDPPRPEPQPVDPIVPEPPVEPDVQVMGYETVTNEDGSQMDVAIVAVDGQPVIVADLDRDGIADVIAADENQNSILEEHEIHDVSGEQLAMQPLQEAAGMNTGDAIVQNEPDYINNANVDDYMA